jgi:hypothetical protein
MRAFLWLDASACFIVPSPIQREDADTFRPIGRFDEPDLQALCHSPVKLNLRWREKGKMRVE